MNDGSGIDYKSDIYAVGIIFYEMLHGFHPFSADNFNSVIYNIRNTDVEINEGLSPLVKRFLEDTLEKKPEKRLSKMSEHELFKKLDWVKIGKKEQEGIKVLE
jgi:serine/threonine protein kinase